MRSWLVLLALVIIVLALFLFPLDFNRSIWLVKNGQSRATIVVADQPDPIGLCVSVWRLDRRTNTLFAAEFLQRYLREITGVELPIVPAAQAPKKGALILVGRSSLTADVEQERKQLPPEGFLIRARGRTVTIAGEVSPAGDLKEYSGADRGTLFGVFEFLEHCAGVRWYFEGELGTVIPKTRNFRVPRMNLTNAPAYPMRFITKPVVRSDLFTSPIPVYRMGNSTGFHANHTYTIWHQYAQAHPEFFAVDTNGQQRLCLTGPGTNTSFNHLCYSAPGVLKQDLENIRAYDSNGSRLWGDGALVPSEKYVRFVPMDNECWFYCRCSWCAAQVSQDSRPLTYLSELIFGYAARLAQAVEAEWPGRRVATAAYSGYLFPPRKVSLPDNVDIYLCCIKGLTLMASPGEYKYMTAMVNEWSTNLQGKRERLYIWDYFCYPTVEVPCFQLCPHVLQRWIRQNRSKVNGMFNNTASSSRGDPLRVEVRYHLLNEWLWCRLLWDPDLDVDQALDEMYRNLFGPAQAPMRRLFKLCITGWEDADWPPDMAFSRHVTGYIGKQAIFTMIYPPAAVEQMRACLAEARKLAPPESLAGRRVNFFGEAFDEFFRQAESYQQRHAPVTS